MSRRKRRAMRLKLPKIDFIGFIDEFARSMLRGFI
jgi:hypothetical protein